MLATKTLAGFPLLKLVSYTLGYPNGKDCLYLTGSLGAAFGEINAIEQRAIRFKQDVFWFLGNVGFDNVVEKVSSFKAD